MTPEERSAFDRKRRARNIAVISALGGLVVLFYLIAMARLTRG
jgi:hypothetical protein